MRIKLICAVLIILRPLATAYAEDLDSGVVLTLNPRVESSFLKTDAVLREGIRSLWDKDDLSSGWILSIDGVAYTPADAGWVRRERRIERGHLLRYSNPTFTMDQELTLSRERRHALLLFRLTNNSEKTVSVEPSLLLDTSLGETTGVPFQLPDGSAVVAETEKIDNQVPGWIKSEHDRVSPSLIISFDGATADRPRRIVMASWIRLKQNGPLLVVKEGRSFSYLPFSENDSAVLMQYDERRVAPGSIMELAVVFGLENYRAGTVDFDSVLKPGVEVVPENLKLREYTIRERLRGIDANIDAIDSLLNNESRINADTVAEVETKVNKQEKLRAEYENL